MSIVRVAGFCMVGWVLTATGSLAGPRAELERSASSAARPEQRRIERAELVDAGTGAGLRLTAGPGGALRASLAWTDLDVNKLVQPDGDFSVSIAGHQDLLILVRMGNRLRVTRGGQTAVMLVDRGDEDGLDRVQQVLAGSHAVRAFRAVHARFCEDSRGSAPGVALDNLDALLGILQGEPGAVERRASRRDSAVRLSRAKSSFERSCYSEYEAEVGAAWNDFVQCVEDVKWYPPLNEVCAFTWLLRTESAWFRFIGCSSIPLRAE